MWLREFCGFLLERNRMNVCRSLALGSLALVSPLACAQVAFNDFGPNNGGFDYNPSTGWTVSGGSSSPGTFRAANQFTSGASGVLTDLILPVELVSGTGNITVMLVNDAAGSPGSTVLESWTTAPSGSFGTWAAPITLSGNGSATLANGTLYWVEIVAANESTSTLWSAWDFNNQSVTGLDAYNQGTGWNLQPGQTLGAFKIDVKPAPEPATMLALAGGAAVLLRRRRRS